MIVIVSSILSNTNNLLTIIWIQLISNNHSWLGLVGLVWFYGISNIVGYLMPNLFYTYKLSRGIQFNSRTLSGATTPGQNGPVSDGNKRYSAFPQAPALLEPHYQSV